jgi:hypothetical protein
MSQPAEVHDPAERITVHLDLTCPKGHFIEQMHIVLAPPWAEGRILPFAPELGTPPDEMPDGHLFRQARQLDATERRITIGCPTCAYAGTWKLDELHNLIYRETLANRRRVRLTC